MYDLDYQKITTLLNNVYAELGEQPVKMALFWERVLQADAKSGAGVIPKGVKASYIIKSSPDYENFYPTPASALYVRKKGQEFIPNVENPLDMLNRSLVQAFTAPSQPGLKRFYKISSGPHGYLYDDKDPSFTENEWIPINREEISSELVKDTRNLDAATQRALYKKIQAWAKENNVPDRAVFFDKKRDYFVSDSLLVRLIKALDKDERARISMPLDIVEKLLKNDGKF